MLCSCLVPQQWYVLVVSFGEARCDSVVYVVQGSCGGVFGFEAVLCMMLLVMYGRRAFSRVFEITESSEIGRKDVPVL